MSYLHNKSTLPSTPETEKRVREKGKKRTEREKEREKERAIVRKGHQVQLSRLYLKCPRISTTALALWWNDGARWQRAHHQHSTAPLGASEGNLWDRSSSGLRSLGRECEDMIGYPAMGNHTNCVDLWKLGKRTDPWHTHAPNGPTITYWQAHYKAILTCTLR